MNESAINPDEGFCFEISLLKAILPLPIGMTVVGLVILALFNYLHDMSIILTIIFAPIGFVLIGWLFIVSVIWVESG